MTTGRVDAARRAWASMASPTRCGVRGGIFGSSSSFGSGMTYSPPYRTRISDMRCTTSDRFRIMSKVSATISSHGRPRVVMKSTPAARSLMIAPAL